MSDDTKISLSDITLRWMVRQVVLAQCGIAFDSSALVRANIPDAIFKDTGMPLPANAITTPSGAPKPAEDVNLPSQIDPANPKPQDPAGSSPGDGSGSDSSPDTGSDPLDVDVDALQPIHDELQLTKSWWLLEIIPLSYQYQDPSGKWVTKWWYVFSLYMEYLLSMFKSFTLESRRIHLGRGRQISDTKPKFHVSVRERMQDQNLKYTPRAKWTAGTELYVE